jgi:hypothetical protein
VRKTLLAVSSEQAWTQSNLKSVTIDSLQDGEAAFVK